MPLIETARGALYLADHRRDGRPVVVLVHGAGGTHLDWPRAVRQVGCLAVDLNGHYKSAGDGHADMAGHADDLAALLDALGIDRAIVCGHSMGGAVALTFAIQHPDRMLGMALISTGARLRVNPEILRRAEHDPDSLDAFLLDYLWAGDPSKRGPRQRPAVVARDYLAANAFDARPWLDAIRMPTLVLCGTADRMTPPKLSEAIATAIPGAELHLIEGAGHMLQLERPTAVAEYLTGWVATL
ncbi:MAG: alpha/beta fold hydrolase [Anaerolineae bacterium]|nr:alpha/beta fold hydrolase [Anaerolineae bacterium]